MKNYIVGLALILMTSCSSVHLVSNWKNPEYVVFDAYKTLVVGMTQDDAVKLDFETKMTREFEKRGEEAVRSIDLFDVAFTSKQQTEEALNEVEQDLLARDFDAILFTKVVGSEDRQRFRKRMSNIDELYGSFRDDYLSNQRIYYDADFYDQYTVYHIETSLYCICIDKERDLVWRGLIDVTDPEKMDRAVDDFVRLVTLALEEQELIFREPISAESSL